jgi:outer membrane protein assembly factor BamB
MKRVGRIAVLLIALFGVAIAVAYWALGYQVRLDGSGKPWIMRVRSADSQGALVESHRAAQKASSPRPLVLANPEPEPATRPHEPAAAVPEARDEARGAVPARPAALEDPPYWVAFRGPNRDGDYLERPILTSWPSGGLTPLWKQPVGGGYASFAIARGRAFTIEQRRHQEVVAAYDVRSGLELWSHGWNAEFREWMGGDGPRATPTWFDGLVYALGALGELRCLNDRTGRLLWRVNILEDNGAVNLPWGMAASPLVLDDIVIVLPGGPGGRSVVAYDRLTGRRRWSSLDDKQAYSSPMLVTLNGRRQILVVTGTRLVALAPDSGELLWDHPWVTANDINASQPLRVGERRIMVSSGYGHGAAVIEITDENGRQSARTVWENTRLKNRFSSSVIHDGYIYGLDETVLTCLDAETGDLKWKAGRYGHGQLLLASGHLVVLSEEGDLALVRATPDRHEEVASFSVLDGKTWNHPALAGGILLVRNLAEMAAFDLRTR